MKIELYGQPIVSRESEGRNLGTEVLFRMGGSGADDNVSPDQYLKAMGGYAMPWFLDATVMGFLMAGDTSTVEGSLFLNVCPETLVIETAFSAWLEGVRELCRRRGPGRVVVEIPEHCQMNIRFLLDRLGEIQAAGALLALDDYPGGNLGVVHLKAFPWSYVKICLQACGAKNKSFESVVREVRRYRPEVAVIAERLPRHMAEVAGQVGVAGFQSFEFGAPEALGLRPFHARAASLAAIDQNNRCVALAAAAQ